MSSSTTLRVAIIGSGPSGAYAAGQLLRSGDVEVDVLERLATPWGLVRGGVAPDHPKIKSVSRVFEKTAASASFRLFGDVEVGRDVTHEELLDWYDAVLYAVGTAADRRSGIPGEDLPGSHSATDFVGWYNGHPDHRDLEIDLMRAHRAVVVGNGNVAIDVARMLCLTPDELAPTDTADHALEVLDASTITEVVVLGRRGPEQAAFTNPELIELSELADADLIIDPAELEVAEELREGELDQTARRNVELLHEYAAREPEGKRRRIVLRFLAGPTALEGDGHVQRVRIGRNRLERDASGALKARATGEEEVLEAGIVLRAIGYTGIPVPGVPFDAKRGLIPHDGEGRITDGEGGGPLPGAYVAGWIKRGPSGVIGTNKKDAQQTVDALLADLESGALRRGATKSADEVEAILRERRPQLVDVAGWQAIDAHEQAKGAETGRPRVKLTRREELIAIASAVEAEGEASTA